MSDHHERRPSAQPRRPERRPPRDRSRDDRRRALAVTAKGPIEALSVPLRAATYIVFDLETTGGNPDKNGITEIAALRYQDGKVVNTFHSLVNPGISIPPIVRKMTGITNAMVKDAPRIDEVMPQFLEFVGDDVFVSHNTIGDMKFLRHFAKTACDKEMTNYFMCTHLLVEKLVPGAPDKSLKGLAQYFDLIGTGRLHRAEADAQLTLELFKVLLKLLEERHFPSVAEAIRFQGDFESAARLGWGVGEEQLRTLPPRPGTYYLRDYQGRIIFLSGTSNLHQEVHRLKRYWDLPKQLGKVVLASTELTFEESSSFFEATLREIEGLKEHKTRYVPDNWHQRIANFVYLVPDDKGMRLAIGPIEEGSLVAMGPVRGNREAQTFLEDIAGLMDRQVGRRGVEMDREEGEVLVRVLREGAAARTTFGEKFLAWLSPRYKKRGALLATLKRVTFPESLRPLPEHCGVLATPEKDGWRLYEIVGGMVSGNMDFQGDLDAALADPAFTRRLHQNIMKAAMTRSFKPLSHLEALMANRVSWWIYFGVRREKGRFISLEELAVRAQ